MSFLSVVISTRHPALRSWALLFSIAICLATTSARASISSQDPIDPQIVAGRLLLARLATKATADSAVIAEVGEAKAIALLTSVMSHGQRLDATAAEWTDMHHAVDALADVYERKGELFRASLFASFQDLYYRNNEQDYVAALAAARRALDLAQRSGLTGSLSIAWGSVGTDLISLGRTDEALTAFRTAQSLLEDRHSSQAARLTRDIVQAEISRGDREAARKESERFTSEANAAPALFRARAFMARSDVAIAAGQYTAALDAVKSARDAIRQEPAADAVLWEAANQLMSLVLDAMRTLPYPDALALATRIDTDFTDLPFAVAPFARRAIRMRRLLAGELDAVLREDTARLAAARDAGHVEAQIEALRLVAVTYRAANGVSQQIVFLEEALALERSLMKTPGVPADSAAAQSFYSLLVTLGDAQVDRHELGKASALFGEAARGIDAMTDATAQRRLGTQYADAVLGKARIAELDDDIDRARGILADALRSDRTGPGRFRAAATHIQFARLERPAGRRPAEAVTHYEQALAAISAERDARRELVVHLEFASFLATVDRSRVPDALLKAQAHLSAAERGAASLKFADAEWRTRYVSGMLHEARGERPMAIDQYRLAVARLDEIRAGLSQQEQRQSFVDSESVQDVYRRLVALLGGSGRRDEAWEFLERGRARSFLEMLHGRRFAAEQATPVQQRLRDLEQQIIDHRVQLSPDNESALRSAGRQPAVLQAELRALEQTFTVERQQAALGRTRSGQALALTPPTIAEVSRLLEPGMALLEFGFLPDGLTAFVVTNQGVEQISWPVNDALLKRNVVRLRAMLADPRQEAELPALVAEVSAALIAPVAKALPGGITHLLIVPAAYLNYLPFQVLTLPDGSALIDRYTISYLPSAATLQFLPRTPAPFGKDLFLGALGNVSVEGWLPLPGTVAETNAIAAIYPEARRASADAFTHDRVVRALEQQPIVHLATHGLVDEQAPLFSALLTSPAAGQPTRLSLYEVPDLTLRARLVVLSACETGLGQLLGGDEVSGLTRTFLLAGAETIVSSLWQVSDESTALLMEGFYQRLHTGSAPAQALRDSALALRKTHPHPFHWAPFVVTGAR